MQGPTPAKTAEQHLCFNSLSIKLTSEYILHFNISATFINWYLATLYQQEKLHILAWWSLDIPCQLSYQTYDHLVTQKWSLTKVSISKSLWYRISIVQLLLCQESVGTELIWRPKVDHHYEKITIIIMSNIILRVIVISLFGLGISHATLAITDLTFPF